MKIVLHKSFLKQFRKLPKKLKDQFFDRLEVFEINPFNEVLNNHSLHEPYTDSRSINVTGDIRAIYEQRGSIALFTHIGTHSELYK